MPLKLVVLPPASDDDWVGTLHEAAPGITVVACADLATAAREIADADAAYGTLPRELLARAGRLRWLQAPMAGPPAGWYYPELVEHPVVVTNFRGIYSDHLGSHVLAYVLAFARGLPVYWRHQQRHEWQPGAPVVYLPDSTALVVGVGGIGSEVARLLAAFRATVLGVDPRREEAPEGVTELWRPEALDHLLPRADFVIVTAPETPRTQGLFDRGRFRLMKPSAYFVNVGRGAIARLDDLVAALRAGEIAGAALDVFEEEPLPPDHPLWDLPNVILTPHVGVRGPYLDERRRNLVADNCRRFAAGLPLRNVVDKQSWF